MLPSTLAFLLLGFCFSIPALAQNDPLATATEAVRMHDFTKAAKVYGALAEQGNTEAMYQLGVLFSNGFGVDRDDRHAVALFSQAAQKGHAKACYSLGEMYEYGRGVDVDNRTAIAWYEKAVQLGSEQAAGKLKSIKNSGAMGNTVQMSVAERLMEASTRGNLDNMTRALDAGANIDMRDQFGNSPLIVAIMRKNPSAVDLLLKRDADPNVRNATGDSPLTLAVQKDLDPIVKNLLDHHADINFADSYGNTPLVEAIKRNDIEDVKMLLSRGADPSIKNKNGQNALLIARADGHDDLVSLLLATGKVSLPKELEHSQASIQAIVNDLKNAKSKDGSVSYPPIVMASLRGQLDVALSLVTEGVDINAMGPDGYTALAVAAKRGDKEMLQLLLNHGASVDISSNDDTSPLVVAAAEGHREIVQKLLPLYKKSDSTAPLMMKAFNKSMAAGHSDCAAILAEAGGQIKLEGSNVNDVIFLRAAEIGGTDLAKMIHIQSSRINITNKEGVTALMLASAGGHQAFIDYLIANHANLNLRDKRGRTALIFAMSTGKTDAALQLINAGADPSITTNDNGLSPIMMAAALDQASLIKSMVGHGASVHGLNWTGDTALSIAVKRHSRNAVKVLLENGADPYQPYETIEDMDSDIDQQIRQYWTIKGWIYKLFDFSEKG